MLVDQTLFGRDKAFETIGNCVNAVIAQGRGPISTIERRHFMGDTGHAAFPTSKPRNANDSAPVDKYLICFALLCIAAIWRPWLVDDEKADGTGCQIGQQ